MKETFLEKVAATTVLLAVVVLSFILLHYN